MFPAEQMDFLRDALCLAEEPLGMFYAGIRPDGFGPAENGHSCVMKSIRAARQKGKAAWISRQKPGCRGAAIYAGFAPPDKAVASFVSTGTAERPGELYMPSPQAVWDFFKALEPLPARADYCVFKPLSHFSENEQPLVVVFFARGELLTGLCQLAFFAFGNHEAVAFPFGSGCASITSWPLHYAGKGIDKAVAGGADPSCRPYMAPDELSFAVAAPAFAKMLAHAEKSFLAGNTWQKARRKIARGDRQWKL